MKILLTLTALLSFSLTLMDSHADAVQPISKEAQATKLSEALMKEVSRDLKKDDEAFKKPGRGPASVEEQKVAPTDKSLPEQDRQYNQLGRPSW